MIINYVKVISLAINLIYVDLFCGAGGTSTGVESAKINGEKCAKVIACVNHDANAIASHAENHPESVHFTEDIRTLELGPLIKYVGEMKRKYPFAKLVLWASLECTNHSKAKGGMSRDADSRTLAVHLLRYINALKPDSVQIENVEEFLIWGPLKIKEIYNEGNSYCPLQVVKANKKRKELRAIWIPIEELKCTYYNEWIQNVQQFGYNYDYRILNSADIGAYTSRKRYFAQFNRKDFITVWPELTHSKDPEPTLFGELQKWKAVREILNLNKKGECIFKKNRAVKTYERIYKGLIKEVGRDHFLTSYYGNGSAHSVDLPIGTLTTKDRYLLHYLSYDYTNGYTSSIETTAGAVTTTPKHNLVTVDCNISLPQIYEDDLEIVKKIKEFMRLKGISKVYMRLLEIDELKLIMGFRSDYVLIGSKEDQKKFIGNAVEVTMARKICEATAKRLFKLRKAA